MDPEQTFNHFRELGMPPSISLDDFLRMYQLNDGNFGFVLESIKGRLLGRQEADLARSRIQQLRDDFNRVQSKPRSKIQMPAAGRKDTQASNLLEDPKEAAKRKQESAERVLIATKLEWKENSERHDSLDKKVRELQSQLRKKQEKLLLLSILEKRETIRLKRLGNFEGGADLQGIGSLLNGLRTETSLSVSELKALVPTTDTKGKAIGADGLNMSLPRSREMVETLTKALTLPPPEIAPLELRLRSFVRKNYDKFMPERLGSPDDVVNYLIGVAEVRAEQKYKFRSLHPISETPNELSDRLEVQSSINQAKQQEIEAALRQIIRLRLQSENHVDTISTFREEASTSLKEMLNEEQSRIVGYIDMLKDHVLKDESDNESEGFEFQARRLLGSSRIRIWEDLQGDLARLQESQGLLGLNLNPRHVNDQGGLTQRIAETLKIVEKSGGKLELLLERKGRKADYGIQLAEEIKVITGAHRKMK